MKLLRYAFFLAVIVSCLTTSCAKRGFITGGLKDTLAPVVLSEHPANYSIHFDANSIKISFDEYVKLDKVNQNLIISPPLQQNPEIIPMGFASKTVTLKFSDTLRANTTYSFNFGQAIKDNNEGNILTGYKYVFSTGDYIDSLKISGEIQDAYSKNNDNFVNIMLYEAATFTDSTVYKERPMYVTNTLDSLTRFSIENIKEGTYYLIALKDRNNNYKFDPKGEKIGFIEHPIQVPNDSLFILSMFKEEPKPNALRPSMLSKYKWLVPYEGDYKNLKINVYGNNQEIESAFSKVSKKDSLHVFLPQIEFDSVRFDFKNLDYEKSITVNTRNIRTIDSLSVQLNKTGAIDFRDNVEIITSTPLRSLDTSKISLMQKDSSFINFKINIDSLYLTSRIVFEKEENQKYELQLLPGAITDFYGKVNDTLNFKLNTSEFTNYGNLTVQLVNPDSLYPLIVELLTEKEDIYAYKIISENEPVIFDLIKPNKYFIRIIHDENNNNRWDSGNYLLRRQPETTFYFESPIDVRANWEVNETLHLE